MSDQQGSLDVKPLILLTGATGYVGGRLLKALEDDGHRVSCLARHPEFLSGRVAELYPKSSPETCWIDTRYWQPWPVSESPIT